MEQLTSLSARRMAEMVRGRKVSPVEVVEAHLRRVERLNPRLNAVVTLAPDAVERAREAERAVMRGEALGALHGVPVTVKDTIDVRGLRSTAGSKVRAGFVPNADALAVARLRAAGAVIIGKTNCSEMALDYTSDNPVFGRTNNPFDPARTPGGSSGGCAAAVAACLTAGSLGSDLVGSIRIPAHFCGVAGLKPTAGLIPGGGHTPPMEGVFSLAASLGPLARSVEDLNLFSEVLAGRVRADAHVESVAEADEVVEAVRGLRVAWYTDDGAVPVTDETKKAVENAVTALKDAGLNPSDERPAAVGRATELWLALFSHATRRFLVEAYKGRIDEAGASARAILDRAPTSPAPDDLLDVWAERDRLRGELLRWMETTPLVVAPVGAVPAFRHGEGRRVEIGGRTFPTFRAFSYAQAFNVFNLPAVVIPAGLSREGLPVGVQIVGRPFEERRVLAAARAVERALGGWRPPPETLPNRSPHPL